MPITCCKDCKKRSAGCHAVCESYKKEKAEHEKFREEETKKRLTSYNLYGQRCKAVERTIREGRRGGKKHG